MIRTGLVIAALAVLPAGLAAQEPRSRTFYESLDLSTPQAAADTFLAAYARSDYETCYAALSPEAQQGFITVGLALFDASRLFPGVGADFLKLTGLGRDAPTRDEYRNMMDVIFDDMLMTAEREGVLPFTIAPEYEVSIALASVSPPTAVATVKTHGTPPVVKVDVLQLPSGRWKVDRVTWDGSDPQLRPWGIAGAR